MERYWKVAGSEGVYCGDCHENAGVCSACGVPTRFGRQTDGRTFCSGCDRTRVTDPAVYQVILDDVVRRAETRLGLVLDRVPPLVVERKAHLGANPGLNHVPESLSGLYVTDGRGNGRIHILSDLPHPRVTTVLSHEIAHAWQDENVEHPQSDRLREGFAEWVAWRLLEGVPGGDAERAIIEARTDVYGEGFQLIARLERESGADQVLSWVRAAASRVAAD